MVSQRIPAFGIQAIDDMMLTIQKKGNHHASNQAHYAFHHILIGFPNDRTCRKAHELG